MSRYGYSIYGQSLYGGPLLSVFSADPVVATPVDYGQVLVTWRAPGGGWDQLKVVRNYLGYPVSVDNGTTVFTTTPAASGTQVTEQNLKQDHWVYYTVFVHDTIDNQWVRAGLARCFVPSDYGGTERMLELVPQVGQSDTLTKFMGVFGYAYDLLRNDINSLLDLHDSMAVSYDLIPLALAQFGIPTEPELEPEQSRRFLRNASFLYKIKGTEPGIHGVVASVTGWQCDVSIGQNLLWTSDYSDFLGSIAGWQALVNASVSWAAPTGPDSGSLQMTATATGAVSSAGITEHIPMTSTEITAGQNLLSANQASIETDASGWTGLLNCSVTRSTTFAYAGAASLALTATGAGDMNAGTALGTAGVHVTPGVVYTVAAYVRAATTPRDASLRFLWYDATGTYINATVGVDVGDTVGGWQEVQHTAQPLPNAAFVAVEVYIKSAAAGEVHYVDQIELFENDGGNLLPGGNFENGLDGWTNKANATLTQSSAQAYTGRSSMAMTAVAAGNMSAIVGTPVTPTPGTSYAFSAMLRAATAAKSVQVLIDWYTTANAYISTSVGTTVTDTTTGWTYVSVVGTAPSNAGKMYPYVQVLGAAAGGVHYVDATYLEVGTTATAWVPSSYSNLVLNPSFETGLANWSAVGSSAPAATHSTRQAWVGKYAARLAWVTGSTLGTAGFETQGTFVMPGQVYTFSAYVYVPSGGTAVDLSVYGSPITGGVHSSLSTVHDQWQRLTVTFTPTTYGWVTLQIEPGNGLTTAAGSICYVDAVQLELGTVANPYVDGDQGRDYSWDIANNLITNPDFETDTSGWQGVNRNLTSADDSSFETTVGTWVPAGNCTVARSTTKSLDGAASMAMTASAAGDMSARTAINVYPVVPGRVYTTVASLLAGSAARQFQVQVYWVQSNGATIITVPGGARSTSDTVRWIQGSITAQAPANAAFIAVQIAVYGTAAAGEVHYVDKVGVFPDPNGNLADGPDFESGLGSWVGGSNWTVTQSFAQAYIGRASLLATRANSTAGNGYCFNNTTYGVVGGTTYTASVYMRPSAATSYTLSFSWRNASNVELSRSSVNITPTANVWSRQTLTAVAPATTTQVAFLVTDDSNGAPTSGSTLYLDALQLVVGSAALPYIPPTTSNLIINPAFEVDTSGWNANSGTLTRDTSVAYLGVASGKVVATSAASPLAAYLGPGSVAVTPGAVHTWSAYVWMATTQQFSIHVDHLDGYGANQGTIQGPLITVPANTWTRVTCTGLMPANSVAAWLNVQLLSPQAVGTTFWVDAVQCELGNVANPYVDGSLGSAYTWDSSNNLIANPSFETDTSGWRGLNQNLLPADASSFETSTSAWMVQQSCSLAQSTAQALDGTHSLAMTNTVAGDMYARTLNPGISVIPGQVYTFSAWFRAATTPRRTRIQVYWWAADGTTLLAAPYGALYADNATGWTEAMMTAQAPLNAATVSINVAVSAAVVGEVHYVDMVSIRPDPLGNLVDIADFENSLGAWSPSAGNSTAALSIVRSYTGRQSMLCTWSGTATQGNSGVQEVVPCNAGVQVTVSAYVYVPTGSAPVAIHVYDSVVATNLVRSAASSVTNSWQRLSVTFTPWSANGVVVQIEPQTNALGTCSVDAVQFVVGSTALPFIPRSYSNFIINPNFEVDTSSWSPNLTGTSTFARVTDKSWVGLAAAKFTSGDVAGAPTDGYVEYNLGNSGQVLLPNTTYTASAWVLLTNNNITFGGGNGRDLMVYNYGNTTIVNYNRTMANIWQRITATFTTGSTNTSVILRFYAPSGGALYIDAVQLEYGNVANPYIDGSVGPWVTWDKSNNLITTTDATDFEGGTTGSWDPVGAVTLANSTTRAVIGTHSLQITAPAGGVTAPNALAQSPYFTHAGAAAAAQFTTYTGSLWVYSTVAVSLHLELEFDGPPGGSGFGVTSTVASTVVAVAANSWTRMSVTGTSDQWAQWIRLNIWCNTSFAASQQLWVDAAQVEQRNFATQYGQSAGTAHLDTSTSRQPWTLGGTSMEAPSLAGGASFGANSLYFSDRSVAYPANLVAGVQTTLTGLIPNTTYTVSAYWAYFSGGVLRVTDRSTYTVLATSSPSDGSSGWNRHVVTFTTGPNTTSVNVEVVNFVNVGLASSWVQGLYLDAVQFEQRNYATIYTSTGVANTVTSTRKQPWCLGGTSLESLVQRTGAAASGTRFMAIVNNTPDVRLGGYVGAVTTVNVAPNTTYTLSAYTQGAQTGAALQAVDRSNNTLLGSTPLDATAPLPGHRFATTFMTGPTTTSIDVRVLYTTGLSPTSNYPVLPAEDLMYVDAVQLEQRNYVTPYGETGSPGSSTSTRRIASRQATFSGSALVRGLDVSAATASLRFDWYDANHALLGSTDSPAVVTRQGVDTVVRAANVIPLDNAVEFSPALVVHNPSAGQRWQWRRVMVNRGEPAPYESGRDIRVALSITDTDQFRRAIHLNRLSKILPRYLPLGATFTLLDATLV